MEHKTEKPSVFYLIFKSYMRFFHDKIYYIKTYKINPEVIPADGTPTLIVSNHQNCLNDPLGVLFTFRDRKPHFITRADVFALHPIANKFLRSIGLLPAFRLEHEGESALGKNEETFKMTEQELVNGCTIMMYPESGHQDKRWLGNFSLGYVKLAFEAAELSDFKTDIVLLPSCNHYSDYFGIQNEFMVKFGKPIHLKDFYELYKTKPRTAQRQANALAREQIENLMLNITDLDNYEAIDFLRDSYRQEYAKNHNLSTADLPSKLLVDKDFYSHLEDAKKSNSATISEIYNEAIQLREGLKEARIDEQCLQNKPSLLLNILGLLLSVILFPVWIISLWPAGIQYLLPKLFGKSLDNMFQGTFLYALNILFFIPIFYLLSLILIGIYINWWIALIYVLLLPLISLFAWYYRKYSLRFITNIRYGLYKNSDKIKNLSILRKTIHEQLNNILK
ncbi:MAG: 1-acyl-sn-glycerol-3-phosphate acyltransferase [Paludibacteraceae bacterium]|nr:1-acyl-sn-glycerol-3-phosphate acyltransferase [Paludibacteraceae bacterium]